MDQYATLVQMNRVTVCEHAKRGELPIIKLGRRVRVLSAVAAGNELVLTAIVAHQLASRDLSRAGNTEHGEPPRKEREERGECRNLDPARPVSDARPIPF